MTSVQKGRLTKAAKLLADKLCDYYDLAGLGGIECRGCQLEKYVTERNYKKMTQYVLRGLSKKAQKLLNKKEQNYQGV